MTGPENNKFIQLRPVLAFTLSKNLTFSNFFLKEEISHKLSYKQYIFWAFPELYVSLDLKHEIGYKI